MLKNKGMKLRFTAYVGTKVQSGFKTTIRNARKRGQSSKAAHPVISKYQAPVDHKARHAKKRASRLDWHIAYIRRCAKRGENCEVRNYFK